jgi:hypothetical protein
MSRFDDDPQLKRTKPAPRVSTGTSHERLAALLFRLARDNVPFGIIEEHVQVASGS